MGGACVAWFAAPFVPSPQNLVKDYFYIFYNNISGHIPAFFRELNP